MKNQLILFPCKHDKSPDVKSSWKNFDQSHYDTALARLSSGKGLVGVVVPSGHFLIDIDSYKPNAATLEQIESKLGCSLDWKKALVQRTRNGGAHYLFRLPENVDGAKLPNTTDLLGLKHVDSRAAGSRGYVCIGEGYAAHGAFEQLQTGILLDGSPVLPEKAIETLLGSGREIIGTTSVEAEVECDEFELEQALSAIDAKTFNEYSTWVTLLLASHKASGGAKWGLLAFDKVSREKGAAGGEYDSFQDISYRWNGAGRSGAADAAGFATIMGHAKTGDPAAFEKIVVERKQAAVISGFDIEPVESDEPVDESVSESGHAYSECFKTKRARNSFALSLNSLVCRAQDKDDFTYVNAGEAGGTEKIRDWALRAATEIKSDFELYASNEDIFEIINEFNDLYTGACVFGVVPEFMRRKFLIMEHGGKTTQVLIRNTDSSWARIAPAVFDSRAVHAESFKGFTNKVSRFNPGCPKTWKISPSWVMSDFYKSQKLTGETFEIFKPKIIQFDEDGYNQKLNMFQPWRALTLCRDVKSGADLSGLREEGSMQQAISREYRVRDAWHIFQQFIYQLVGADIGKIGDDGSAVTTEREYWARMLIATMASTVQRPDVRREWALILKGSQGVGKSTTTEIMRRVLGDNVSIDGGVDRIRGWKDFCGLRSGSGSGNSKVVATSLKGVTDRFNTILRGQLVCVIEELDVDEKISTSDELKHVLTSGTINIEAKGIDVIEEKSYLNFYIFSNKVMPMMLGAERRFSVIETALRDDVGADAVNEYMARLRFSHVDGSDFVRTGVRSGAVPEFEREKWIDTDFDDGETFSDEGTAAYNAYLLECAEYKRSYFNTLHEYLIGNDEGIKALGAALALVDIATYCPEFNLKHGFASTEKNAMQAKSVGESSISAIDSARLSRFSGKTEGLCDWLWGKDVVNGMINGSQLILKNIQAQTLFCDGTGTEMLSHRRAELVNTLRDCLRGDNVMEDKVVDVISSMDDPLLNPYVVDLKQLSQDCLMGFDQHHSRDASKPGNHLKMIRHILSALGYKPYIELFKRNGGNKRGVLATTMKGGVVMQKWLKVDSLYVFGGKVDGQQVDIDTRDYKLVRLIFGAVNKPGI